MTPLEAAEYFGAGYRDGLRNNMRQINASQEARDEYAEGFKQGQQDAQRGESDE